MIPVQLVEGNFGFSTITAANLEDSLDLMKTALLSKCLGKYADGSRAAAYLKIFVGSKQLIYLQGLTSSKAIFDKLKARYQVLQDERL